MVLAKVDEPHVVALLTDGEVVLQTTGLMVAGELLRLTAGPMPIHRHDRTTAAADQQLRQVTPSTSLVPATIVDKQFSVEGVTSTLVRPSTENRTAAVAGGIGRHQPTTMAAAVTWEGWSGVMQAPHTTAAQADTLYKLSIQSGATVPGATELIADPLLADTHCQTWSQPNVAPLHAACLHNSGAIATPHITLVPTHRSHTLQHCHWHHSHRDDTGPSSRQYHAEAGEGGRRIARTMLTDVFGNSSTRLCDQQAVGPRPLAIDHGHEPQGTAHVRPATIPVHVPARSTGACRPQKPTHVTAPCRPPMRS